ncbi:MAG TPA: ribbon-helix-helix domain-containing protein [Thermoplasmata archaeon]|nr:ribbon-helix-helix domain-containing protein [Thermoplasmata archaeon]
MDPNDRVTLRLDRDTLRRIEEFAADHKLESRSQLLRRALEAYIEEATEGDNKVTVRIPRKFLELIDHLVREGHFNSREDAVVDCVRRTLTKENVAAIRAQHLEMGKATGRVIDVQDEVVGS